jgi:thiamine biosynthesis lipoprotein
MNQSQIIFEGIGTHWVIDLYNLSDDFDLPNLERLILDRVEKYDQDYSRFRKDSMVWKMSVHRGWYTLPPDGEKMLDLYKQIYDLTGGKVTPLVGDLISGLGYDQMYSFRTAKTEPVFAWNEAIELIGRKIEIKKNVLMDFGAAGKGHLVDLLSNLLVDNGVKSFLIDGGGDIYSRECNQKIGLENPNNSKEVIGVVWVNNASICASATNRRVWGGYHHIIDPVTRKSTVGIVATWVIAKEAILADMLATCLFFVDPEVLKKHFDFEYLILDEEMQASGTKVFREGLFSGTN